jgi:hypothetical protein
MTVSSNSSTEIFSDAARFVHLQRVAKVFAASELVPQQFRGEEGSPGHANTIIALNMSTRLGADPMAVLQNLYVVHGKPGWSSQFVIACVNTCGRFEPLRFTLTGTGDDHTCIAWTRERGSEERLESPPVSIAMAKKEGWYGKNGSKWQTMPELMLRYRAATFFGRLYCPEIMMGMRTIEEVVDIDSTIEDASPRGLAAEVIATAKIAESPAIVTVEAPTPTAGRNDPQRRRRLQQFRLTPLPPRQPRPLRRRASRPNTCPPQIRSTSRRVIKSYWPTTSSGNANPHSTR